MKRNIFLFAILSFLLFSCKKEEEIGLRGHFIQYFIGEYHGGMYRLFAVGNEEAGRVSEIGIALENVVCYQTPEWDRSQNTEEFLKIADRNGDGAFNDWVSVDSYVMRMVFADNFLSVHLTSDRDWDDEHPAGTYLDDLVVWNVQTYSEFIRSGYKIQSALYGLLLYDVKLSDVQPQHLEMISDEIGIYSSPRIRFLSAPNNDEIHTLTLTITTTEGEVHKPTIAIRPQTYSLSNDPTAGSQNPVPSIRATDNADEVA